MKKKLLSLLTLLVAGLTLTACGSKAADKSTSEKKPSNIVKVEKSSSSSKKEEKASATLTESTVTYLTDQEIDAIQTIGDYKAAFKSLSDSYIKDFDELIGQLPTATQEMVSPMRDQLDQMMTQQQEALTEQFAAAGATDDTPIPAEIRETMVSSIKLARDQLVQAMDLVREQAEAALGTGN